MKSINNLIELLVDPSIIKVKVLKLGSDNIELFLEVIFVLSELVVQQSLIMRLANLRLKI